MRFQTRRRLISFDEAAERLGVHANTIRRRLSGTELLTHVPTGGRRIFLIEDEVESLLTEWIRQGEAMRPDQVVRRHLRAIG